MTPWGRLFGSVAAVASAGMIAAACGSGFPTPVTVCKPNATIACVGAGGCAGAQSCKADGSGYDTCVCGASVDAGPNGDGGGPKDAGGDVNDNCKRVAPSLVCGLDPQCGCGPKGTCTFDPSNFQNGGTLCVQSTSNGGAKTPCSSTSECSPGLACLYGLCRPFCSTDGAACNAPGTYQCAQRYYMGKPIPNGTMCMLDCTLDDPSSCGGGTRGCIWFKGDTSDCADLKGYNTFSCTQQDPSCAPGYACMTDNTCRQWCMIGSPSCNFNCQPFTQPVTVRGIQYGFCP